MKSFKALSWVALVNVSLLVACGGVSKTDGTSGGSSGNAGAIDSTGGNGQGGNNQGGGKAGSGTGGTAMSTGGKDSNGGAIAVGGAPPGSFPSDHPCMTNAECPGSGEPCQMCADGHMVCHDGYCDGPSGTCKVNGGFCTVGCATNADCPASHLPCTDCGDGAQACPTTQCQAGFCEVSYPGCPHHDPCAGMGCGEECQACQGSGCTSSVQAFCNDAGRCQPGPPSCGAKRCLAQTDCGAPADCSPCTNGSGACATYGCIGALCQLTCTESGKKCKVSSDCPTPDADQCVKCVSGSCAIPACIDDACQMVCIAE
jgi:hypothetical protein